MHQPSIIDVHQDDFTTYWGQLGSEHQSPYKANVAFAELHNAFAAEKTGNLPTGAPSNDYSFVVVRAGRPLIGCCLILQEQASGGRTLGCRGIFATSELDSACLNGDTNNVESDVFYCLNKHLDYLIEALKPDLVEFYDSMHCGVMSPVSHWLLAKGAMPVLCAGQLLDLRGSYKKLMLEMDKAYRDAIAWGERELVFRLLDSPEELDSMQLIAANPDSDTVFLQQSSNSYYRSLLNSGKAYIIQAFVDKKLVASSTFLISQDKAQYIASITRSGIESKAVLQSLIWEGVRYARSLGLSWVELISPELSAGEAKIVMSGFGGVEQVRFKLLLTKNEKLANQ